MNFKQITVLSLFSLASATAIAQTIAIDYLNYTVKLANNKDNR